MMAFVRLTEWTLDRDRWFHIYVCDPLNNPSFISENEGLDPIAVRFQQKNKNGGINYSPSFVLAMFRKQISNDIIFVKLDATDGSVIENVLHNAYKNGPSDMITFRDSVYYSHLDVVVTAMTYRSTSAYTVMSIVNFKKGTKHNYEFTESGTI